MKEFVCGLMFDRDMERLVLRCKQHPFHSSEDVITTVSGPLKEKEKPLDGMARIFFEQAGLYQTMWDLFCILTRKEGKEDHRVYFCKSITTRTEELKDKEVVLVHHEYLGGSTIDDNLRWLIPFALTGLEATVWESRIWENGLEG